MKRPYHARPEAALQAAEANKLPNKGITEGWVGQICPAPPRQTL